MPDVPGTRAPTSPPLASSPSPAPTHSSVLMRAVVVGPEPQPDPTFPVLDDPEPVDGTPLLFTRANPPTLLGAPAPVRSESPLSAPVSTPREPTHTPPPVPESVRTQDAQVAALEAQAIALLEAQRTVSFDDWAADHGHPIAGHAVDVMRWFATRRYYDEAAASFATPEGFADAHRNVWPEASDETIVAARAHLQAERQASPPEGLFGPDGPSDLAMEEALTALRALCAEALRPQTEGDNATEQPPPPANAEVLNFLFPRLMEGDRANTVLALSRHLVNVARDHVRLGGPDAPEQLRQVDHFQFFVGDGMTKHFACGGAAKKAQFEELVTLQFLVRAYLDAAPAR